MISPEYWMSCLTMMLLLCSIAITAIGPTPSAYSKPGCQDKCGNVSVPYPFGIGDPRCAINEHLFLNCTHTDGRSDELLLQDHAPALSISVLEGTMTISTTSSYDCYNSTGGLVGNSSYALELPDFYTFSDARNMLAGIGCDTVATIINFEGTYGAACLSICNGTETLMDNTCSGSGCCQTSITRALRSLFILTSTVYNHTNVSDFNPCGYAFLADKETFKASDWQLHGLPDDRKASKVVIEWVVENKTCEEAQADTSSYACGNNTRCSYSENGNGYRCLCKDGFRGDPYLSPPGCQDIDECADPQTYPCKGKCKNTSGNYTCSCPVGKHGDGKIGCQGLGIAAIVSVTAASIFLAVIGVLLYLILTKIRKDKNFRENGGMVLKNQNIRIFSEAELAKATKNYDDSRKLGEGGFGCVYRGVLPDTTQLAVKKFKVVDKAQMNEEFQHEISMVLQVNHKNVVKLLGLCLHTKVPLLVYEFISNKTLYHHIHDKRSQVLRTWRSRLRVATETALALDYLHSLANPPIIHGDIKTVNILLDEECTAKIADFGASVLISSGQTDIATKIKGTFGYLDPEYLMSGNLTVRSDVFSFGVVLVELLTGQKPNSNILNFGENQSVVQNFISSLENKRLSEILDFEVAEEEMELVEIVAKLAKRCVKRSSVKRPSMKEVSDELARLKALEDDLWGQQNSVETEHLLEISGSLSSHENESPSITESQTITQTSISFETGVL